MSDRVPMRLCTACRASKEKYSLIRVVKVDEKLTVDKKGIYPGRGAYICPDEKCIRTAAKRKALERALKIAECGNVYEELMEVIK